MADTPQKLSNTIIIHSTLFGTKPDVSKKDKQKYAAPKRVKGDNAKSLSDARKKIAKNADKATTASGKIGQKDLPSVIKQVDPQGTAQVIPEMYQQMQMMLSLLAMGSGSSGGGSSGTMPSFSAVPSGISVVVNDSFTGALAILVKKWGFEIVIRAFNTALQKRPPIQYLNGYTSEFGVENIDPLYRAIVLNSLANIVRLALYFGPLNIPVSEYDETVYGDTVPSPLVDESEVPDLYLKQYYELADDPYPGYVKWISQDGNNTTVYTKKPAQSYHFSTMNEEIFSISEKEIAADLDPWFEYTTAGPPGSFAFIRTLSSTTINEILYKQMVNIETNTLNSGMGNNAANSPGGGGGGGNMAGMLGGMLQMLMQMFQSEQLPTSVLNQGNINNVMQQFTKDMGLNNQIFQIGQQILGGGGFMGGSPLGMLSNMGGIGNIMGGFGLDGGGLGGVLGGMGLGSLMGGFGSFGGGSGGGGGGAGSGFGGASGGGEYSGGGVTIEGLQNIEELLAKLGIEQ